MNLVEATSAVFGYGSAAVVRTPGFVLQAGQRLGMFGPNGSGKTTLVRGITGLLPPIQGRVTRAVALRMGYLAQLRGMDLYWPMTALDAASLAVSARGRLGWIGRRSRQTIGRMLQLLQVNDLAERRMAGLSGGQQQRILLAGALAADPQLLVLDEPTEGLDVRSRTALLRGLRQASDDGLCTIMISHALDDLVALCDRIAWFHVAEVAGEPSRVEMLDARDVVQRVAGLQQVP